MAHLSIREAVKHYQVSRPTLTKALKNGKISGVQDGKGQWQIDPAELARVYNPRETDPVKSVKEEPVNLTAENTPDYMEMERLKGALAVAEARADAAEKLAQERADRIDDLRRMLPPPNISPRPRWRWPWSK